VHTIFRRPNSSSSKDSATPTWGVSVVASERYSKMAGVADKARFYLERAAPQLREFEEKQIFSKARPSLSPPNSRPSHPPRSSVLLSVAQLAVTKSHC
jgi:hypothetical protein